jgi:hypothetical protein
MKILKVGTKLKYLPPNIGGIWAKLSKSKALFLIATIKKGGKSLEQQIAEKIEEYK